MIEYEQAIDIIDATCAELRHLAVVSRQEAPGACPRGLAATSAAPRFDNAAMDGFALRSGETAAASESSPIALSVKGVSMAGDEPADGDLPDMAAVEIATGAALPSGADAVVPYERVTRRDAAVEISAPVEHGTNVRRAGEDFSAGEMLLSAGTWLEPHHQLIVSASGYEDDDGSIVRPPACGIVITGSEINAAGEAGITDLNGAYLTAALSAMGIDVVSTQVCPDDGARIASAIDACRAEGAGLILTSGGVSAGRRDLVLPALESLGADILFHKVAIRPGKPVLFARLHPTEGPVAIGLPGNPVAAALGFRLFAIRALRALCGAQPETPLPARLATPVQRRQGFDFYAKARAWLSPDATLAVTILPGQESFKVAPFATANCWARIGSGTGTAEPGELVSVLPMMPGRFPDVSGR